MDMYCKFFLITANLCSLMRINQFNSLSCVFVSVKKTVYVLPVMEWAVLNQASGKSLASYPNSPGHERYFS